MNHHRSVVSIKMAEFISKMVKLIKKEILTLHEYFPETVIAYDSSCDLYMTLSEYVSNFSQAEARNMGFNIIWGSMRETLALLLANNKGRDQPAHPHSLISAFVIRYLKNKVTRSDMASTRPVFGVCEQHRRRPACASAQSDQCLCYSHFEKYHNYTCFEQIFNYLASHCS